MSAVIQQLAVTTSNCALGQTIVSMTHRTWRKCQNVKMSPNYLWFQKPTIPLLSCLRLIDWLRCSTFWHFRLLRPDLDYEVTSWWPVWDYRSSFREEHADGCRVVTFIELSSYSALLSVKRIQYSRLGKSHHTIIASSFRRVVGSTPLPHPAAR